MFIVSSLWFKTNFRPLFFVESINENEGYLLYVCIKINESYGRTK